METQHPPADTIESLRAALVASEARADAAKARLTAQASNSEAVIATLKLEIEKLRRQLFGTRSERTARLLEQYELQLEELEAAATEDELAAEQAAACATTVKAFTLETEVAAWTKMKNTHNAKADWQFTSDDARIKLKHLYPSI